MNALSSQAYQMGLPTLDSPPPAPWGGDIRPPQEREPLPEEDRPAVEEPWSGPTQPVREPGEAPKGWRLQ